VKKILEKDMSRKTGAQVRVKIYSPKDPFEKYVKEFPGKCLDHLDIETNCYEVNPALLKSTQKVVEEQLFTHLLKSNCLVTGQI